MLAGSPAPAQPSNDLCSGAIPITLDTVYTVNTADATSTGDPASVCSGPFGQGVWYRFTPPTSGMLTLSTCGSDFDTTFEVYSGGCGSLTWVTCADDNGPACANNRASASFLVYSNLTYLIVAGGYAGATGNLSIVATMPAPPNDQCSGAIPLVTGTTYTINTANATETGDPVPTCQQQFGKGVWFSYTPDNSGPVTISSCGSDLDTVMQVYTGSCGALTPFVCDDDNGPACGGNQASVRFNGTAHTTYLVLVGGFYGLVKSGNIRMLANEGTPANDLCSGAVPMTEGVAYTMNTAYATSTGDPLPVCRTNFGNGVWYTFNPLTIGIVTISTCGSDFDTLLQVYSGDCSNLTSVIDGCNNDGGPACAGTQASVSFNGAAGITHYILAGGFNRATGNLRIIASVAPALANDNCGSAIPMAEGVSYTLNTTNATSLGDPIPTCQSNFAKGVWYSFTPSSSGVATISTCGSDFDTVVQVHSGTCAALTAIMDGCNNDNGPACVSNRASVSFSAVSGVTYLILAGGYGGATGNLNIRATLSPVLANDQCSGAIPISDGVLYTCNTATATSDGDPTPLCQPNFGKGIWYSFTPLTTTGVTISTAGSDFPNALQVFTGACGALAIRTNSCNNGNQSSIFFVGIGGVTYYLLIGGIGGATGDLKLLATVDRPLNDRCQNSIPMTPGSNYLVNTSYATSTNDPVPGCEPSSGKAVWYSFTLLVSTNVTVSTCGSDFDTVLQVYTGSCGALTSLICNDDDGPTCAGNRASITFPGIAGTTYVIQVGGHGGAVGNLNIAVTVPSLPNDSCSDAIPIAEGSVYIVNTTYANSAGDPLPQCQTNFGKGVWYSFTPTNTGFAILSTCGSDFDTLLQVYSGSCGALSAVACDDDDGPSCRSSRASVGFVATAGTTYLILAGGYRAATGNLAVAVSMPGAVNDQCGDAIAMTPGVAYGLSTANATETGDPTPVCQPTFGKGVWYTFTPSMSGVVSIDTCGSDFDTAMQIFTGDCGALTPVDGGCNDDGGPTCASVEASVNFNATAGVTYWILAGGYGGGSGNLEIIANLLPALTIARQGTNVMLYWPTNAVGFYLQSATNLVWPISWTYVYGPWVSGDNYAITNTASGPRKYYRLKK